MATLITLDITSAPEDSLENALFRLLVDRDWLLAQRHQSTARATLVLTRQRIAQWNQNCYMRAFGTVFWIDCGFINQITPELELHASGSGTLEELQSGDAQFRFRLTSGAAELWSTRGLLDAMNRNILAPYTTNPAASYTNWRSQLWPETGTDISAVTFGAREIQVETLQLQQGVAVPRRRLELLQKSDQDRIWQLCECQNTPEYQTPDAIHAAYVQKLGRVFESFPAAHSQMIRCESRRTVPEDRAVVYYRAVFPNPATSSPGRVEEFVRTDFDIVFSNDGEQVRWQPRTLQGTATDITLHDGEVLSFLQRGENVPNSPALQYDVRWEKTGSSPWSVQAFQVPQSVSLCCTGTPDLTLAGDYVWQYAALDPSPFGVSVPAWIRHHLPDTEYQFDFSEPALDGPIVFPQGSGPQGWQIQLDLLKTGPETMASLPARNLQLTVSTGTTSRLRFQAVEMRATAISPRIDAFSGSLSAPAQPPNARAQISKTTGEAKDLTQPTRLVFRTTANETVDPAAVTLIVRNPANSPRFVVQPSTTSSTTFYPFIKAAGIEPVSSASGNLRQQPDVVTGRIVIERDGSHGLTAWHIVSPFEMTSGNGNGCDQLKIDAGQQFVPVESRTDMVFALAPWVVCQDEVTGTSPAEHRVLHHRNLVLEHSEYAAASQDRSASGKPMALAANRADFVAATRDAWSVAVDPLPATESTAAEIRHWLPGAELLGSTPLTPAGPKAYLEMPQQAGVNLDQRLPSVKLADSTQKLRLLYENAHPEAERWLNYDLKWNGWSDPDSRPRPQIEIVEADASTPPVDGRQRARFGSTPLLFDSQSLSAVTFGAINADPGGWIASGDSHGQIRIIDALTGTQLFNVSLPNSEGKPIRAVNVATPAAGVTITAIDVQGRFAAWRANSGLTTLNPVTVTIPLQQTRLAVFAAAENLVVLFKINEQPSGLDLWIWDTATASSNTNPLHISQISGINPDQVVSVDLVVLHNQMYLAVARDTQAPLVYSGVPSASTWQFQPIPFATAITTGSSAVTLRQVEEPGSHATHQTLAVISADRKLCSFHRLESGQWVETHKLVWKDNPLAADSHVLKSAYLVNRIGAQRLPLPGDNLLAVLVNTSGQGAAWPLPFSTQSVNLVTAAPFRLLDSPAQSVAACCTGLITPAIDVPAPGRVHLAIAGADGIPRLYDVEGGLLRADHIVNQGSYDALGTVLRPTASRNLTDGIHSQRVTYPVCPSGSRQNDSSAHLARDAVRLTVAPADESAMTLVKTGTSSDDFYTEIRFRCEQLVLLPQADPDDAQATLWVPVSYLDQCNPGGDRPAIEFPFYRGHAGDYHFDSSIPGEKPSLNCFPRLAGLPACVTRLLFIRVTGTTAQPDFSQITEVSLQVALVNPLDVSGEPDDGHPELADHVNLPLAARLALGAGAILNVRIKRENLDLQNPLKVVQAESVSPFQWTLPAVTESPVTGTLPARLTRIAAAAQLKSLVLNEAGDVQERLVLSLVAADCRAEILEGSHGLIEVGGALAGYGNRADNGHKQFGFEQPRAPFQNGPQDPSSTQTEPRLKWPLDAKLLAAGSGPYQGNVAVALTNRLVWLDAETALKWSESPLAASPAQIDVTNITTPNLYVVRNSSVAAWDCQNGQRVDPGMVSWSLRAPSEQGSTRLSHQVNVTALASVSLAGGSRLITGDEDSTICVWDTDRGLQVAQLSTTFGRVRLLAGAPGRDDLLIFVAGELQGIQLLRLSEADGWSEQSMAFPNLVAPVALIATTVTDQIHLAAADLQRIVWQYRALNSDAWTAVSLPNTPALTMDIGRSADAAVLFYLGADRVLKYFGTDASSVTVSSTPLEEGTSYRMKFAEIDSETRLLSVAIDGSAPVVWQQVRQTGTWGNWTQIPRPELPDSSLAIFLNFQTQPTVLLMPVTQPGDPVFQLWQLATGVKLGEFPARNIFDQVTDLALSCVGLVQAPHAAVVLDASNDVKTLDLRNGTLRAKSSLNTTPARNARFVHLSGQAHVFSSAGTELRAWDALTAVEVAAGPHQAGASVSLLASNGRRLLMNADKCITWIPTLTLPWYQASDPVLPVTGTIQAMELSRNPDSTWAVLTINESSADRFEVWDLADPDSPLQRVVTAAALTTVTTIDQPLGTYVAVRSNAGSIDVWDVSSPTNLPVLRWRLTSAGVGPIVATGQDWAPRLLSGSQGALQRWDLTGVWGFDSSGSVRAHVCAALRERAANTAGILATVIQYGPAFARIYFDKSDGLLRSLIPASVYRGVSGFLFDLTQAGTGHAQAVIALWRNARGELEGSWLEEQIVHQNLQVMVRNAQNQVTPMPNCTASLDLVRMKLTAFTASSPAFTVRSLQTGRIEAQHTAWSRLQILLGDMELPSVNVLGHLQARWKPLTSDTREIVVQGPVPISLDFSGATPQLEIQTGIFRFSNCGLDDAAISAPDDLVQPLAGPGLLSLDLVGTHPADAPSPPPEFVQLMLRSTGLRLDRVDHEQIPVDLCLDDSVVMSLPTQASEIVQLTHRQSFGRRLRYAQGLGDLQQAGQVTGRWALPSGAPPLTNWLIAPLLVQDNVVHVYQQTLVVSGERPSTLESLQTENLVILAPASDAAGAQRGLSCLESITGEAQAGDVLLGGQSISAALEGITIPGVVIHRTLTAAGPAWYECVLREEEVHEVRGIRLEQIPDPVSVSADFRSLPPGDQTSRYLSPTGHYQPARASVRPDLDTDRTAWRRVRLLDTTRPAELSREIDQDYLQVGLLVSERTAFYRLPTRKMDAETVTFAKLPTPAQWNWFHPHALEIRYAPDKPGAMQQHRVQGIKRPAANTAALACAPCVEFALRDPQQLVPPVGAKLEIERASRLDRRRFQAEQIDVAWKETVGSLLLKLDSPITAVPLQQVQPIPPAIENVQVEFGPAKFVQCFLRINDELLELDNQEARFPIYDARQTAFTDRDLGQRDQFFIEEPQNVATAPELGRAIVSLRATSNNLGGLLLAIADKSTANDPPVLKVWPVNNKTAIATLQAAGADDLLLAEFASYKQAGCLLANTDGHAAGLHLMSIEATPQSLFELQVTGNSVVTNAVAMTHIAFDDAITAAPDVEHVDVYAALRLGASPAFKPVISVWTSRAGGDPQYLGDVELPGTIDPDKLPNPVLRKLACVFTMELDSSQWKPVLTFSIATLMPDPSPDGSTAVVLAKLKILTSTWQTPVVHVEPGLTCYAAASRSDQQGRPTIIELIVGADQSPLIRRDPSTWQELCRYADRSPANDVSVILSSGRPVVVSVLNAGTAEDPRFETRVWDAESGLPLRRIPRGEDREHDYWQVAPFLFGNQVHLAAGMHNDNGTVQVFHPRLSTLNPPDLFIVSPLSTLFNNITLTVRWGSNPQHSEDVVFAPQLLLEDRQHPGQTLTPIPLASLFGSPVLINGVYVWRWGPAGNVVIPWELTDKLRIGWQGRLSNSTVLVADLFAPLSSKKLSPVPYSAVSPKLAIVLLADRVPTTGNATPLLQRTLLFGDAANADKGEPQISTDQNGNKVFEYVLKDEELVETPTVKLTNATTAVSLLVVKYLNNGQALATGKRDVPLSH